MATASPSSSNFSPSQGYDGGAKFKPEILDYATPRSYPDAPHLDDAPLPPLPYIPHPSTGENSPAAGGETKMRLRKACDSCSVRKVKCDESGPPCRSCAALDIPCTFQRPSRRRGPPNRHAEAFKRQKLEHDALDSLQPISPTKEAAFSLASLSIPAPLSAESICDFSTLQVLIDDYFLYIHPLIPLPHEPTFRESFKSRQDRSDRTFLALIAAMVKALVASFPRRPRHLFSSENARKQFPTAGALIDRCHQVFGAARGPGYLDGELTLYDSLGSYLVGMSSGYIFDHRRCRLYFAEAVMILRILDLHRAPVPRELTDTSPPTSAYTGEEENGPTDYITQEMARRLFWLYFVGAASVRQLGSGDPDVLIPPYEQLPPMPLEIDDAYIHHTHIDAQPAGIVSELTGFNYNARVFRAYHSLASMEMAFGRNELYDWDRQRKLIVRTLHDIKAATNTVPRELTLDPSPAQSWPWPVKSSAPSSQASWADAVGLNGSKSPAKPELSRREVQYEIQKANIYCTQLGSRSSLVEKYWNLYELQDRREGSTIRHGEANSPTIGCFTAGVDSATQHRTPSDSMDSGEHAMAIEREDIVRDLVVLLQSINQVNMEPNGLSVSHKIRQVASTLLLIPHSRMSMPSLDAEQVNVYLKGFLDILNRLDRLSPGRFTGSMTPAYGSSGPMRQQGVLNAEEIEEQELVHWASLKEHQEKFARENGFLTGM